MVKNCSKWPFMDVNNPLASNWKAAVTGWGSEFSSKNPFMMRIELNGPLVQTLPPLNHYVSLWSAELHLGIAQICSFCCFLFFVQFWKVPRVWCRNIYLFVLSPLCTTVRGTVFENRIFAENKVIPQAAKGIKDQDPHSVINNPILSM